MLNPIQSVLAAEQSAQEQIEQVRIEAEDAVKRARRRSREIIERSEKRTYRSVTHFEDQSAKAVTREILRMRRQHRQVLQRHVDKIDESLDKMIGEVIEKFWPQGE